MKAVLLIHLAATWFMVGLIWFVQIVHYPMFDRVGRDGFAAYEIAHSRLTTWVVGPPMIVEFLCALALVARRPDAIPAWWTWTGLALVGAIWLSTALLQVPLHGVLAGGFDARAHAILVASNWIRTAAWTARGILAAAMIARTLR